MDGAQCSTEADRAIARCRAHLTRPRRARARAGYYNKLMAALPGSKFEGKTLEEIIQAADGGVFNNAAQIWNHSFYWRSMSPSGGGEPSGPIAEKINESFGSFAKFKEEFTAAAGGHFGSGWAWLVQNPAGNLAVVSTHDAGNPMRDGLKPILTCDVWEHAYYIDYRNAKPEYIKGAPRPGASTPPRPALTLRPRSMVGPGQLGLRQREPLQVTRPAHATPSRASLRLPQPAVGPGTTRACPGGPACRVGEDLRQDAAAGPHLCF